MEFGIQKIYACKWDPESYFLESRILLLGIRNPAVGILHVAIIFFPMSVLSDMKGEVKTIACACEK